MRYKFLPIVILAFTGALTWAAIAFLPESLYFPVVEYSIPGDVQIAVHKNGELDQSACLLSARNIARAISVNCPSCKVVERCLRGLVPEHRKILSRESLSIPSLRTPGGKLVQSITAKNSQLALGICLQIEQHSASSPVDQRLRCYPAFVPR